MTAVATSYWPADTSEPVLETTVGGVLRAAAAAGLAGLVLVTVNPALRQAELAYVLNQSGAAGLFLVKLRESFTANQAR